jgi:hypothetical protein
MPMVAAPKLLLIAALAAGSIACHKQQPPPQDQNIAMDSGNIPENADIEMLPPDESSGTSSTELENGDDNPDVNDLNTSGNSD